MDKISKERTFIKEKLHEYYTSFYINGGNSMTPFLYQEDNNIDTFKIPFDIIRLSEIQKVIESDSIEKAQDFLYEMLCFSYPYRKSLKFTIWMIFVMNTIHILNHLSVDKINHFVFELIRNESQNSLSQGLSIQN
jgi:hypothetical protein